MNWKECERKRSWSSVRYAFSPRICP